MSRSSDERACGGGELREPGGVRAERSSSEGRGSAGSRLAASRANGIIEPMTLKRSPCEAAVTHGIVGQLPEQTEFRRGALFSPCFTPSRCVGSPFHDSHAFLLLMVFGQRPLVLVNDYAAAYRMVNSNPRVIEEADQLVSIEPNGRSWRLERVFMLPALKHLFDRRDGKFPARNFKCW